MSLDTVISGEVSGLTNDEVAQVHGGFWPAFIAGAVASAIVGDAANSFIDGASDAIADNIGAPSAGGV